METTIQVSRNLLEVLKAMRIYQKESYEEIIWDMVEDRMEFSEETKKNIEQSKKEIKEGKTTSIEEIKKRLNIAT